MGNAYLTFSTSTGASPAAVKWDRTEPASLRYNDSFPPLCFDLYDERNSKNSGFYTRLGTWIDEPEAEMPEETDCAAGDQVYLAGLIPNPEMKEYPVWNTETKSIGRGLGAANFGMVPFSLAKFRNENSFMAEPFKRRASNSVPGCDTSSMSVF